ncbi:hypothetical protein JVU11DRAFT_7853 [Chiua virens]|nr:hypothetical protein JVU11DRAFT_7853 [Chiua virens]
MSLPDGPYHTGPQVLCISCTQPGCRHFFKSHGGHTVHIQSAHPVPTPPHSPPSQQYTSEQVSTSPSPVLRTSPLPPPSPLNLPAEIDEDGWEKENFDVDNPPVPSDDNEPDTDIEFYGPQDGYYRCYHPKLTALPCDRHGNPLPPGTPPITQANNEDWFPYSNQLQFEMAEFLYLKCQMLASKIDTLLDLWAVSLYPHGAEPPF